MQFKTLFSSIFIILVELNFEISIFFSGYGGGEDDRTDNDWRRDEGPPGPRSDDRRGGGFERR